MKNLFDELEQKKTLSILSIDEAEKNQGELLKQLRDKLKEISPLRKSPQWGVIYLLVNSFGRDSETAVIIVKELFSFYHDKHELLISLKNWYAHAMLFDMFYHQPYLRFINEKEIFINDAYPILNIEDNESSDLDVSKEFYVSILSQIGKEHKMVNDIINRFISEHPNSQLMDDVIFGL